jgi:hypothetical protein
MQNRLKQIHETTTDWGTWIGKWIHWGGKNIIKGIFLLIFSIVVGLACLIVWAIITSIIDKDAYLLKRISGWLVKHGLKRLKPGDIITIYNHKGELIVDSEEYKGGKILVHPCAAQSISSACNTTRFAIITHKRGNNKKDD